MARKISKKLVIYVVDFNTYDLPAVLSDDARRIFFLSQTPCAPKKTRKNFYISSWDEMGKYDIPAMIDKILEKTGQEKIFYIGHSMGTTGFMAMANDRPQYQEHIHMATFLAPVAFVEHMASPLRYLAPFVNEVEVKNVTHMYACLLYTSPSPRD